MLRVRATRAASICVFVIQARSSVCRPNSPKSIRRLREAVPLRLPRWDLRYFTLFGINGMAISPQSLGCNGLGRWWWRSGRARLGRRFFLLTNPTFDPDLAVNGVRFGEAIIDSRAQSMQRHFAFPIPF